MHRRSGKTKTVLNQQISRAIQKQGLYLYLFPTYKQAKKVIWYNTEMMSHFPDVIIENKNNSELFIKLKNGSLWMLGGADNPSSWKGTNPIDVVFDEYSEMKEEMWTQIIRPILAENKGIATFVYTPKGQNHGWKIFNYAKQNKGLWDSFFLTVEDTKVIPTEELGQLKNEMTQAFYEQEFMCRFLEGAGQVFKRIEENLHDEQLEVLEGKYFNLGIDLGKYQDWTVLTPFDLHTFKAGFQERFNQIDWNLQESKIEAIIRRYNNAKGIIDSTGLGDPVYDNLSNRGLNIEPYKFSELSRKYLLENLAILLERDRIKIPNDLGLIEELKSAQYMLGEKGKVKIVWPEGLHDDRVMSLALAVWGIENPLSHSSVKKPSKEFSERTSMYNEFLQSRFHYN